MTSRGTSSLNRQRRAISHAHTVLGKRPLPTWNGNSSKKLSMSATSMAHAPTHCTCLGNHSYTHISSKQFITLRPRTKEIQSFLQQMELFLTSLQGGSWKLELTESYGVGGGTTFHLRPLASSKESVSLGFSLKRRRKKSLRYGLNFQE